MTKIIQVNGGKFEESGEGGVINISYPILKNLMFTVVFGIITLGTLWLLISSLQTNGIPIFFYAGDFSLNKVYIIFLIFLAIYSGYRTFYHLRGLGKSQITIDPKTRIIQIKGKNPREIRFTEIKTLVIQPGSGIIMSGSAFIDILLTLNSDENIILVTLSDDDYKVAIKADEIIEITAKTVGISFTKEEISEMTDKIIGMNFSKES